MAHQYKNGNWKQITLTNKDTVKCNNLVEEVPGVILLETRKGVYKYTYNKEGQGNYSKLELDTAFTTLKRVSVKTFNGNINLFIDSTNQTAATPVIPSTSTMMNTRAGHSQISPALPM